MSSPTFRLALLALFLTPGSAHAAALAAEHRFDPAPGLHLDAGDFFEIGEASAVEDIQVWFGDGQFNAAPTDGDYPELRVLDFPEERIQKAAWISVDGEGIGVMAGDASLASLTEAWILLAAPLLMPALLRLRRRPRRHRRSHKTWADQASEQVQAARAAERNAGTGAATFPGAGGDTFPM